jgi:hypothetical protein
VLFAWASKRFARIPPSLAILTPAALLNVWDGQFGFVFGSLWLAVFCARPTVAGVTAGIAAFKPQLAVMLLPRLIRAPRVLAIAALILALFVGLTLPIWGAFFVRMHQQIAFVATAQSHSFFLTMMPSPFETYGMNWAAQAIFAIAAIGILTRYRCGDVFALATATFLIVPYVHNYDMTVESLGCVVALLRNWPELSRLQRGVLVGGYLAPILTFLIPYAVPPILLATLYVQARSIGALIEPVAARGLGGDAMPVGHVDPRR